MRRRGVRILAALGLILLTQLGLVAVAGAQGGGPNADGIVDVDPGPHGQGEARHPLLLKTHARQRGAAPQIASAIPSGYTPAQIQAYLGLSGDGSGQTIAIVDAFDHPSVEDDLNHFSAQFDLPQTCGSADADPNNCFHFTKATPQGQPWVNRGWALEIALDVEWAHAVAPKAGILLVEARNSSIFGLLGAVDYAARQGASVISNSWGTNEFRFERFFDAHCALSNAVCVFSSGDDGNPGLYPAYNPAVIAVGGTTLHLGANGAVLGETAWAGSGGGISITEPRPAYQDGIHLNRTRGIPDVSYDADPSTGFAVYDSVAYQGQSGWFVVGGTSAGAPQWAAIVAVADQLRAAGGHGRLNSTAFASGNAFYSLAGTSGLEDITSGSNGPCGSLCHAQAGYDFVTGLGSPRAGIDQALVAVTSSAVPAAAPAP
ncbi:MAG TPA: S53 family peptidase [Thermomicrobiaceae bacterium]|nr:S53 family peptidase [Thermomicrobiaceae bacterium]